MPRLVLYSFRLSALLIAISGLLSCGGSNPAPINAASLAAVSVAVVPPSMSIPTGTTQPFTANVNNSSVSGVQWLVNGFPGGGGNIGTIDSSGNYTAPQFIPNPPNVTITAIPDADNTKSGSAQVTIVGAQVPAQVAMSPTGTAYLQVGTSMPLSAVVTGPPDTGVIWQVVNNGTVVTNGNSSFGTITPGANGNATYKAPAALPPGNTVTIRAASHAQPNVFTSCKVVISLGPPPFETVIISPAAATVEATTFFGFTATVIGAANTAVTWEVNGQVGGSTEFGSVGPGLNTGTATYFAPTKAPVQNVVTVTAVSQAQSSATATASVTIAAPPSNPVSIQISSGPSTLAICSTAEYMATVGSTVGSLTNPSITWEVNGITGGDLTYGTITPEAGTNGKTANYVAPLHLPSDATVVIGAIPDAAPTKADAVDLTLTIPQVTINVLDTQNQQSTVQVGVGQTIPFEATVKTPCGAQTATWYVGQNGNYVEGGNSTLGTISPDVAANLVTYTAPATVPSNPTVVIKATADAAPSDFSTATVTINSHPVITVSITPSTPQTVVFLGAPGNSNVNYQATVAGTTNTELTWEVNGIPGGDNTCACGVGTIDVPNALVPTQATYTAPAAVPSPATVQVTAVSVPFPTVVSNADPVTIINPPPPPPTITIEPSTIFPIIPGQTLNPSAEIVCENGGCNQVVDWSLSLPSGVPCTVATCGSLNPTQTNNQATTYSSPPSIPTDPYFVNLTATDDSDQSVFNTVRIEITSSATTSLSISPTNPTIQAGSASLITFTATLVNAPADTPVQWELQCNSLAPAPGENCGVFFPPPLYGPGCISDPSGHEECHAAFAINDPPSVSITYIPPEQLGTGNFVPNSCISVSGPSNGLVPLVASVSGGNCPGGLCEVTACITVTPP